MYNDILYLQAISFLVGLSPGALFHRKKTANRPTSPTKFDAKRPKRSMLSQIFSASKPPLRPPDGRGKCGENIYPKKVEKHLHPRNLT